MYFDHARAGPGALRRLAPRHLDLLGAALQRLCGQTRAEFARTLAELAAGFVCEAVSAALAAPTYGTTREPWPRRGRGGPILNAFDDPMMDYDDDLARDWEEDHASPSYSTIHRPTPAGEDAVPVALAVGLRLAAWWLCRRPGRPPLLSALAVGAVATGVALAGGPAVLAGLGLAEAVLGMAATEGASRLLATLLAPSDD